ncbi:MAG: LPS export ABC transporter periplasmic protein LptC [Rhodospirillaceae bacterium]|nr:LPS export ABC transporter periplasmic protein LptC [Rhodospirillaceae bacterium]MDH5188274.1 LPS export ABC transporter periplasmic protein LptC [Rhodospirillaceae bacterium]
MTAEQTEPPLSSKQITKADVAPQASTLVGSGSFYDGRESRYSQTGYSNFVKFMKIALPLVAVVVIALILWWPYIGGNEGEFKIGFSSLSLAPGEQVGADNARYFGVDDKQNPYSISADLARFPDGPKGPISLEIPKADITMDSGTWLVMTAIEGVYNQQKKILSLSGSVNLFHDMGYEITTDELNINLAKNDAIGTKPVSGHGPFGELNASGVRIDKNNGTIFFIGPARLVLFSSQGKEIPIGGITNE